MQNLIENSVAERLVAYGVPRSDISKQVKFCAELNSYEGCGLYQRARLAATLLGRSCVLLGI